MVEIFTSLSLPIHKHLYSFHFWPLFSVIKVSSFLLCAHRLCLLNVAFLFFFFSFLILFNLFFQYRIYPPPYPLTVPKPKTPPPTPFSMMTSPPQPHTTRLLNCLGRPVYGMLDASFLTEPRSSSPLLYVCWRPLISCCMLPSWWSRV